MTNRRSILKQNSTVGRKMSFENHFGNSLKNEEDLEDIKSMLKSLTTQVICSIE